MDLRPYVENIHRQLLLTAEAGGEEARALAERLVAPLEAAIRLALQDVLAAAAEEITVELAPGSVELRLRGRDPDFVVTPAPVDMAGGEPAGTGVDAAAWPSDVIGAGLSTPAEADEGGMARINLRLPDQLKARVEGAAGREGLSVNAWLVRAATGALQRTDPTRRLEPRAATGTQHFTGWAR